MTPAQAYKPFHGGRLQPPEGASGFAPADDAILRSALLQFSRNVLNDPERRTRAYAMFQVLRMEMAR